MQAGPDGRAGRALLVLLMLLGGGCQPRLADGDPVVELAGARHRFTSAAGVRWHWVEAGSGDPVVLLHGMPGTWHEWLGVMPSLASRYRVIAPDLKAMGGSSAPDGDYSFCAVGAELIELFDALEIRRFRLVGHDWGAMIGACLASRVPQRVIAYAHISAALQEYDLSRLPDYRELAQAPETAAGILRSPEVLVARLYSGGTGDTAAIAPEILERRSADLRGRAAGVSRYFRDLDLQERWNMGPRMRPAWERMPMSIALIVGDRDLQVPLEAYLRADDLILGPLTLIVIDDAGHFPAEEQPQRLAAALVEVLR